MYKGNNRSGRRYGSGSGGGKGRSPEEIPLTAVRTPLSGGESETGTDDESSPRHQPYLSHNNRDKKWKWHGNRWVGTFHFDILMSSTGSISQYSSQTIQIGIVKPSTSRGYVTVCTNHKTDYWNIQDSIEKKTWLARLINVSVKFSVLLSKCT